MRHRISLLRVDSGRQFEKLGVQGIDSPAVVKRIDTEQAGPIRTCIGCREHHPKRELLRLVAGYDAEHSIWVVQPDPLARASGRGAHLHPTPECFELAKRRRAFDRALRHDVQARGGPLDLALLEQHLKHRP